MDYNTVEEVKLRKYKKRLSQCGEGFIVLGLWNILKIVLMIVMQNRMQDFISEIRNLTEGDDLATIVLTIVFILFIVALVFAAHFDVGIGAVRYANGKRKRATFLMFTAILLLLTLAVFPEYFSPQNYAEGDFDDTVVASVLIDFTLMFISVEMFVYVSLIKKISKKITTVEGQN